MKVEWANRYFLIDGTPNLRVDVPVVRVEELQQWVNDKQIDIASSFINCDEISAYRLALEHLMAELEKRHGGA